MAISSRSFTFYGLYTETPTPFHSLSLLLKEPDETRWWRDWPEFGTGDTHSLRVEQWRGDKGTLSLRGKRDPQSAHEWMRSSFTLLLLVHKISRLLIALALGSGPVATVDLSSAASVAFLPSFFLRHALTMDVFKF
jgi:hypothetical protein